MIGIGRICSQMCQRRNVLAIRVVVKYQIDWAPKQNGVSGIVRIREVTTKDKRQFLMNPKRFSAVSSDYSGMRIRVATDLTLLKGALADGTRKFKANSWRDNDIQCSTGSLMMG